jgi:type II secretory pathway pseudopilin PulG
VSCKKTGLTLVEILVVLGIIALLVGILIPAVAMVNKTAKEAKQHANFSAIELALEAFKKDYGDYPPSNWITGSDYCGAQKLAEALLGWDLLGFHPKSDFKGNGKNNLGLYVYDVNNSTYMDQRKLYLETGTSMAFKIGSLYNSYLPLANTYVLCDVFSRKKVLLPDGSTAMAGNPILYYRANSTEKTLRGIYQYNDNYPLLYAKVQSESNGSTRNPLFWSANTNEYFYNYIKDPKRTAIDWPYRSDSYLLISAGADGLYGTSDDIRNFGN